ncbi:MAG: tetratricopeptide repeat protein [Bacteroidia bacterium]
MSLCVRSIKGLEHNKDSLYNFLKRNPHDTSYVEGYLYYVELNYLNDPDSCFIITERQISFCNEKLKIYKNEIVRTRLLKALGSNYNNLGFLYNEKGLGAQALELYLKGLDIQKQVNDKRAIGQSYNNIGFVFYGLKDAVNAYSYYKEALLIRREIKDSNGVAQTLNNIGLMLKKLGDPDCKSQIEDACLKSGRLKAINYYEESRQIMERLNNISGVTTAVNNLGGVYKDLKDYDKALDYYLLALTFRQGGKNMYALGITLNNIGSVYFAKGDVFLATEYVNKAYKIAKEMNHPMLLTQVYSMLIQLAKEKGDFETAFNYLQENIKLNEMLNGATVSKEVEKIKLEHDFNEKRLQDSIKVDNERQILNLKISQEATKRKFLIAGLIALFFASLIFYNRMVVIKSQKKIIENQKKEVELKNSEIVDSINYAKRIQYTLLAKDEFLYQNFPEHFVFFKPKDIVSGDFYWATVHNGRKYIAVCDCTGHGVPGAFMSLLSIGFLSEAINEKGIEDPAEIFNYVRQRIINNVNKDGQKDGFDGILLSIDENSNKASLVAANNKPVLVRDGSIEILEANRMPVGIGIIEEKFKSTDLELRKGDTLYLYTDGFADQFGGPKGKKFKYKSLNELLAKISSNGSSEQKEILNTVFNSWKENLEQVDDVCIVGLKFN